MNARVWQDERGVEGALDWGSRLGERRFSSRQASCDALIPALVFALSVQIQIMAVEAELAPATDATRDGPSPPPGPASPVTPASGVRVAPARGEPSDDGVRPTWRSYGGLGGSLGGGVAPTWTALGRVLLAVHNGRWLFELGAEGSLPATGRLDTGESFRQSLLLGTAAACGERGALTACGVMKLGGIVVRGIDVDRSRAPTGFVAQAGPRVGVWYRMGDHVGLLARIEGLFLLTPWTVELNQVAAWTMPRLGFSTGIDLVIQVEQQRGKPSDNTLTGTR